MEINNTFKLPPFLLINAADGPNSIEIITMPMMMFLSQTLRRNMVKYHYFIPSWSSIL